jgi:hypothetical protein
MVCTVTLAGSWWLPMYSDLEETSDIVGRINLLGLLCSLDDTLDIVKASGIARVINKSVQLLTRLSIGYWPGSINVRHRRGQLIQKREVL